MKTAKYRNKDYCISFGKEDVVEVELEMIIRQILSSEVDQPDKYEIANLSIKLVPFQEFTNYLFELLTLEQQQQVYGRLLDQARKELEPELFSLFHVSELVENT